MDHALPRLRTRRRRPDPLEVLCAFMALLWGVLAAISAIDGWKEVHAGDHADAVVSFSALLVDCWLCRYWFREWWRRNQQR